MSITIYTDGGEQVRQLYEGMVSAGANSIEWNGADDAGNPAPEGLYIVWYRSEEFEAQASLLKYH